MARTARPDDGLPRGPDGELGKSQAKTENTLRRALRLAVQDARGQRKRNQEFAEIMAQIAAAQLVNQGLLKEFLERGGNGKH